MNSLVALEEQGICTRAPVNATTRCKRGTCAACTRNWSPPVLTTKYRMYDMRGERLPITTWEAKGANKRGTQPTERVKVVGDVWKEFELDEVDTWER